MSIRKSKLPVEPGEYSGEWIWEDRRLAATVELNEGASPSASFIGDFKAPARSAQFPERVKLDSISGPLHTNQEVVLKNVRGEVVFHQRTRLSAEFALAGMDAIATDAAGYTKILLQTTDLPLFFGSRPWASIQWPEPFSGGTFSVESNGDAAKSWKWQGATFTSDYEVSVPLDCWDFRLPATPRIAIEERRARDVDYWWNSWIVPFRTVITLATRRKVGVTSALLLGPPDEESNRSRSQLFRAGISQELLLSTAPDPFEESAFTLATLTESFPKLLSKLRALQRTVPVVFELLLAATTNDDLQLRAKYLYLAQAAEELHRTRFDKPTKEAQFRRRRRATLDRLRAQKVKSDDLKWLKNSLPSRPLDNFANRLRVLRDELGLPAGSFPRDFAEEARKLRNSLSHGANAESPFDVARRFLQLEALCVGQVFFLIGLSSNVVVRAIEIRRRLWERIRDPDVEPAPYAFMQYETTLPDAAPPEESEPSSTE